MWRCPCCHSSVDDSFEVCWSCGATADGIEDSDFIAADQAEPAPIEGLPKGTAVDDPLADFAGTPMPDLVECYTAKNTVEARFVADRLMEQGIPAIADNITLWGYASKVRVRQDDLFSALTWLKSYDHRQRFREDNLE